MCQTSRTSDKGEDCQDADVDELEGVRDGEDRLSVEPVRHETSDWRDQETGSHRREGGHADEPRGLRQFEDKQPAGDYEGPKCRTGPPKLPNHIHRKSR